MGKAGAYLQKMSVLFDEEGYSGGWEALVCNWDTALGKSERKQKSFMHFHVHVSALFWNDILKFKHDGSSE